MRESSPRPSLKLPWKLQDRSAYEIQKKQSSGARDAERSLHLLQERYDDLNQAWPQVCFLHLAKTAGCSINEILQHRFSVAPGIRLFPGEMETMPSGALADLGVISAHFSISHLPLLRGHRFLFTLLRDPVDRVLSSYFHLKGHEGPLDETNIALMSAKTKSLHDFICDDRPEVRSFTENLQANALVSDWRAEKRVEVPSLGKRAIEALEHFHLVGLVERFEESVALLLQALRWKPTPSDFSVRVNKTPERLSLSEVEHGTIARIRDLNQNDQQLYDYVVEKWKIRPGLIKPSRDGALTRACGLSWSRPAHRVARARRGSTS